MEKTIRIVIETKGGFRFGYEKKITKPEPKDVRQITYNAKGNRVNTYA